VEAAAGDLERLEGQGHAAGAFLAEQQVRGAGACSRRLPGGAAGERGRGMQQALFWRSSR
jgi:hypothetical protein